MPMTVRLRAALVAAIVAALSGVGVDAAQATSLVYVKDGNVFVADADGSHAAQVTTDGSTADPTNTAYRSPSEADDGTIVAAKGGELVRMRQNGTVLGHFVPDTGGYPLAAAVSPDGAKIAYNFSQITQCTVYQFSCGYQPQPGGAVASSSGSGGSPGAVQQSAQDGQWIDNGTLVLQEASSYVDYEVLGQALQHWFVPADTFNPFPTDFPYPEQPVVSRAGHFLAVVMRPNASGGHPSADDVLEIWQTNGAPPAVPTPLCGFRAADAGGFQRPAFTPDGSAISWGDAAGVQTTALDPSQCHDRAAFTLSGGQAAVAGGAEPSYGLAANNPGPAAPGGAQPTPLTAKLTAASSVKRSTLLTSGIKVKLACSARCAYGVAIGASNATARKLKLSRKTSGSVVLGTTKGTTAAAATVIVKLTAKARAGVKRLKRGTSVALVLEVQAVDAGGKKVTRDYRLTVEA